MNVSDNKLIRCKICQILELPDIKCTVFNKFGFTAINCPRSLQIFPLSKMAVLHFAKESIPVWQSFQTVQSRKACNSGEDCVAACKPTISDFAREFAAIARL
jgi:hypothetical protein